MTFHYVSHPEVEIDPGRAVTDWTLSDRGRARLAALSVRWPAGAASVYSSPERKAMETASALAPPGTEVMVLAQAGEIDRSSTGYVTHDRHAALAAALFAHPDQSADGWETARAAQARMVVVLAQVLRAAGKGTVILVGHGGVGSLLWCHVAGQPIAPGYDQPHQGCVWTAQRVGDRLQPVCSWQPYEAVI